MSQKKMKFWFGGSSVTEDILTMNSVWRVSYCKLKVAVSGNRKLRVQRKMGNEFTMIPRTRKVKENLKIWDITTANVCSLQDYRSISKSEARRFPIPPVCQYLGSKS